MPPVFGPASPSPRRLWSCDVASGNTWLPSTIAMKLASSPSRNSSTTTLSPAGPKRPANMACVVSTASSVVAQITTPLPAARPSAFTTSGAFCARIQAGSKSLRVKVAYAAVGMPWRFRKSFVKAFEPSRRAARRLGPKQRRPSAANASVTPEHQRTLGADDRQVDLLGERELQQARHVVRGDLDVARARLERRARVARRDEDLRDARRLRDLPRQRVLAAARTDDQYLHECSRR